MGKGPVNFSYNGKRRILFAPLDWGLGHATRSIPLLKYLAEKNHEIIIVCKSKQKMILEAAFPEARFETLKSYSIRLGKSSWSTRLSLLLQSPNFWIGIRQEKRAVEELVKKYQPTLILSDNCYGFRSNKCRSVLITHQLSIRTGLGIIADKLLGGWNRRMIHSFDECWIPDTGNTPGLAGALSHTSKPYSIPLVYLGGLSRFSDCPTPLNQNGTLVILLSGPEPQRSLLEEKILSQANQLKHKTLLIRGVPNAKKVHAFNEQLTVMDFMEGPALQECLCKAAWVICRPGYSTLMDLVRIKAKALLVPTPGQAEQEYLARHFRDNGWACAMEQHAFELNEAIEQVKHFSFRFPSVPFESYKGVIDNRVKG